MLAYNLSNPDRPNADQTIAVMSLEIAKDILSNFGVSNVLSSRIWTIFGDPTIDYLVLHHVGAVYSNLGDWGAARESLLKATKVGESSAEAVDYGLYAYVF